MPFQSKSQANVLLKNKSIHHKEWLKATKIPLCCLPLKKGMPLKCRYKKVGESVIGKVQTGSRGGKFFLIKEKQSNGKYCITKIYLKKK